MLDFFIQNQAKISSFQKDLLDLEEIKEECLIKVRTKNKLNKLETYIDFSSSEIKLIPQLIPDPDFQKLYKINSFELQREKQDSSLTSLFSSPLCEKWKESLACKGDNDFLIRSGFYQDEIDIYESILLGFDGLTLYVSGLDIFQIQYLTEVARDYYFSVFFVIHTKAELDIVLKTDAPYFIFSCYEKKNFNIDMSFLYKTSQFVPKSASLFAMVPEEVLKNKSTFKDLGFCGLIYPVAEG